MKKITITEIAKLANVSIGTVDRAINNRPGINQKTKEKILDIVRKYNYSPNRLSKALANKKVIKIGMITLPETIPFVKLLIESAKSAEAALSDYGCRLTIRSLKSFDVEQEVNIIQEFIDSEYDAIAIEGLDHPEIISKINSAVDKEIPVVTFNTDVPLSKRMCFIGQNLCKSGEIAADLLCKFMGRQGNLFILQGYHKVAAHAERLNGFLNVVETNFPEVNITGIEECFDDTDIAFVKTSEALKKHPEISGIYSVASGNIGIGKAISESNYTSHINFVCNDYIIGMKELLERDIVDATILQDPSTQGSLPINILFKAVFDNIKPSQKIFYTSIQIMTKHHEILSQ